MPAELYLRNDQSDIPVDLTSLQTLGDLVLAHLGAQGTYSAVFLPEEDIVKVNERHFNRANTTDVMAFPLEPEAVPGDDHRGEILICPAQAARQALEYGKAVQNEFGRLLIHGLLHLFGWRDDKASARKAMLDEGEKLLLRFSKE